MFELFFNTVLVPLFVGVGASFSYDELKKITNKKAGINAQAISVLTQTYDCFCDQMGLEEDEDYHIPLLVKNVGRILVNPSLLSIKDYLSLSFDLEFSDDYCALWEDLFVQICSNPDNQWLYNYINANRITQNRWNSSEWMNEKMKDNYWVLPLSASGELLTELVDVSPELDANQSASLFSLLYEITLNAEKHGASKNQRVTVTQNSILLIDDGMPFNPNDLLNRGSGGGGETALKLFLRHCPDAQMDYIHEGQNNILSVTFHNAVFNINGKSRITFPSILELYHEDKQVEYPKGRFKYCFIEMNQYPIVPISGIYRILDKALEDVENKKIAEKVYISYKYLYRYNKTYSVGA